MRKGARPEDVASTLVAMDESGFDVTGIVTGLWDRWLAATADKKREDPKLLVRMVLRLCMYLAFLLLYSGVAVADRQNAMVYFMQNSLTNAIMGVHSRDLADINPQEVCGFTATDGGDGCTIQLDMVDSVDRIYLYLRTTLHNALYTAFTFDGDDANAASSRAGQSFLFGHNMLIGGVRLSQLRTSSGSCSLPSGFRDGYEAEDDPVAASRFVCHRDWSTAYESTAAFGSQARRRCPASYDYADPAANTCDGEELGQFAFDRAQESASYMSRLGHFSYRPPGFTATLPNHNGTEALETLATLYHYKFIDLQTRVFYVDVNVYNTALNYLYYARLIFEIPTAGGVFPQRDVRVVDPYFTETASDIALLCLEGIVILLHAAFTIVVLVAYGVPTVRAVLAGGWRDVWRHLAALNMTQHLWNIITIVQIATFFTAVSYRYIAYDHVPSGFDVAGDDYINWRTSVTHLSTAEKLTTVSLFVSWLRLFEFVEFYGEKSFWFVIFMFVIFLCGSTLSHQLAFGFYLYDYRNFLASFISVLRSFRGELTFTEFSTFFDRQYGPLLAFLYVIIFVYLIVTLVIAILRLVYKRLQRRVQEVQEEEDANEKVLPHESMFSSLLHTNTNKRAGAPAKPQTRHTRSRTLESIAGAFLGTSSVMESKEEAAPEGRRDPKDPRNGRGGRDETGGKNGKGGKGGMDVTDVTDVTDGRNEKDGKDARTLRKGPSMSLFDDRWGQSMRQIELRKTEMRGRSPPRSPPEPGEERKEHPGAAPAPGSASPPPSPIRRRPRRRLRQSIADLTNFFNKPQPAQNLRVSASVRHFADLCLAFLASRSAPADRVLRTREALSALVRAAQAAGGAAPAAALYRLMATMGLRLDLDARAEVEALFARAAAAGPAAEGDGSEAKGDPAFDLEQLAAAFASGVALQEGPRRTEEWLRQYVSAEAAVEVSTKVRGGLGRRPALHLPQNRRTELGQFANWLAEYSQGWRGDALQLREELRACRASVSLEDGGRDAARAQLLASESAMEELCSDFEAQVGLALKRPDSNMNDLLSIAKRFKSEAKEKDAEAPGGGNPMAKIIGDVAGKIISKLAIGAAAEPQQRDTWDRPRGAPRRAMSAAELAGRPNEQDEDGFFDASSANAPDQDLMSPTWDQPALWTLGVYTDEDGGDGSFGPAAGRAPAQPGGDADFLDLDVDFDKMDLRK